MLRKRQSGRLRRLSNRLPLLVPAWVLGILPAFAPALGGHSDKAPPEPKLERVYRLSTSAVRWTTFSESGRLLFALGGTSILKGWHLRADREIFRLDRDNEIWHFALTPDERYVITAGATPRRDLKKTAEISLWEVASWGLVKKWVNSHSDYATRAVVDPHGKALGLSFINCPAEIWDFPSGRRLRQSQALDDGDLDGVGVGPFFPSGGRLLIRRRTDYQVWAYLWDLRTGQEKPLEKGRLYYGSFGRDKEAALKNKWAQCGAAAISPDGKVVAGSVQTYRTLPDKDGFAQSPRYYTWLRLWDAGTGKVLTDLECMKRPEATKAPKGLGQVAFHPDGRHLLILAEGGTTIQFWDLRQRRRVLTWRPPAHINWQFAISPAGDRLATCHDDGTVRLWRLALDKTR